MKRVLGVLLFVFVVGAGGVLVGMHLAERERGEERERERTRISEKAGKVALNNEERERLNIKTALAVAGSVEEEITTPGRVTANMDRVAKVGSLVSGRIASLRARVGDVVSAGQVLAIVDSTDVAHARAAYQQASERVQVVEKKMANTRRLADAGMFTQRSVDQLRKDRDQAASDLSGMRVAYENETATAEASTKSAQAALSRAQAARDLAAAEAQRNKRLVQAGAAQYKPLEDAQREGASAKAALLSAQSNAKLAENQLARTQELFEDGISSRQEVERAQTAKDEAAAAVEQSETRLTIARQALTREQSIFDEKIYANREVQQADTALAKADRDVDEAAAALEQARTRLRLARSPEKAAALKEMESRLTTFDSLLRRETEVSHKRLLADMETQTVAAEVAQAKVELQAAANALRVLRVGDSGRVDAVGVAVVSPIRGRVVERPVSRGDLVNPSSALFTVIDLSSVWVDIQVYQSDLARVRPGMPVEVGAAAYPGQVFRGVIRNISDVVDARTKAVEARAEIRNPGERLKDGLYVTARLGLGIHKTAVLVPAEAIVEEAGKKFVFIAERKEYEKREVTVGVVANGKAEIRAGVKAGERVVVEGQHELKAPPPSHKGGGEVEVD